MSTSKSRRNKKIAAVTAAVVVAASSLLVGTLAWQSLNQTAKNILVGEVNPGGRLHDDYDGNADKNIFVENFGDQNIFARIKLSEILIMGDGLRDAAIDANGGFVDNSELKDYDVVVGKIEGDKLIPETYIYEPGVKHGADTWIEKVWGGQDWYMPTYDKNEKSIFADLNGTANYTENGVVKPYGDFIDWTKHEGISKKETYRQYNEAYADYSKQKEFDGYYYNENGVIIDHDNSTGKETLNIEDKNGYYVKENVFHVPDMTLTTSEIITMDEWVKRKNTYDEYIAKYDDAYKIANPDITLENYIEQYDGASVTGNFWVFDSTTEYFYWAQPIAPDANDLGESEYDLENTTGLLVDKLKKTGRLDQDHYYELIVDADFVTVDDLLYADEDTAGRGFHTSDTGVTSDATKLFLETIGAAVDAEAFTYVLDVNTFEHHIPYGSKIQLTGFDGTISSMPIGSNIGTLQNGVHFEHDLDAKTIKLLKPSEMCESLILTINYNDGFAQQKIITIYLGDTAAPTITTP